MRLSGLFIYLMPKPRPDEEHDDFIERCIPIVIDDGTAGSPEQAVAVCNSIWDDTKGASMPKDKDEKSNQFLFVELMVSDAGKPFDGVAPGEFVDMWGRDVDIEASDFPEYLKNTKDAIEHTRTEDGELVGLPIDAYGHLDDEAAGWIVEASLTEVEKPNGNKIPVIQFVAKWTEKGRELIEKGIRRMFSPTLNTKKKIILGGSLTNWPATRDDMGKVLLRPISLSEAEVPIELERLAIPVEGTNLYGTELVKVEEEAYEETADEGDPVEDQPATAELVIKIIPNEGEQDMTEELTFTKDELQEFIKQQVQAEAAKALVQTATGAEDEANPQEPPTSLMELFGLNEMEAEAQEQFRAMWVGEYDKLREDARRQYIAQLALINHEREMTNLSTGLVNGSEAFPRGLPIQADQLQQAFMNLPKDQVPFWRDLLKAVQEKGLIEFEELGNSKKVEGQTPLPEEYANAIRNKKMTLEDLADPILALGDLKDYDLSEFRE